MQGWKSPLGIKGYVNNWAATWQNQQSDCAPSEDLDQPGHPPSLIKSKLSAWRNVGSLATHWAHSGDSVQTVGIKGYVNNWAATWQNQRNDCAPSEDSDQPGHPPSLIRVFAVRMKKPGSLATHRAHSADSDQTGRMPRLIWVFAGALSFCWFCHVVAQLYFVRADPDGDVVAFSTDEELMEALGYVTDGVFKVYITLKGRWFLSFFLLCV